MDPCTDTVARRMAALSTAPSTGLRIFYAALGILFAGAVVTLTVIAWSL